MMPVEEPVLLASNRGYRYGDGLFETIKVRQGTILLANYHFERLFAGLTLLKYQVPFLFAKEKISEQILQLCKKNNCEELGRVRLSVSRGNGGLYDDNKGLQWLIECWALNPSVDQLNENGLLVGIYPDVQKSCDAFSNLKSANFLPYTMAAQYARENKLNDCLVLNTKGTIADATIANLFIIQQEQIITPGLDSGCVNGVMRRYIIEHNDFDVKEAAIATEDLRNADEVFLTNAINGIRWVGRFGDKNYGNEQTQEIYRRLIKTIEA